MNVNKNTNTRIINVLVKKVMAKYFLDMAVLLFFIASLLQYF